MKLNIGIQASYLFQGKGGIERFCAILSEYLAGKGHVVYLFCRNLKNKNEPTYRIDSRVNIEKYNSDGSSEYRKKLRYRLEKLKIDVFLSSLSNKGDFFWPSILATSGIPFIIVEHSNPWIIEKEKWNREERLAAIALADKCNLLLNSYELSIPVSMRDKLSFLPNPIPEMPRQYMNSKNNKLKRIICVGRIIESIKQHSLLVDAFSIIADDFPGWSCIFYGEGKDKEALDRNIIKHNLQNRIIIGGVVEDVYKELVISEIFCIPSRHECFPISLVEGMMASLPCVGFKECSGVNEIIIDGKTGYLAEKMSAKSLAHVLKKLMINIELRNVMGKEGAKKAQDYLAETILPRWERNIIECASLKNNTQAQALMSEDMHAKLFLLELCSRKHLLRPNN